ncbi:MAG: RdgB/HAM1 family non-canonical purine NTP pyrophosphatase [Alphaproteobacteria bacterium]|nr:RdgB/HAM1 family non-canonical purine NTP pyrophosphatase [Alphaproteobacteria bacterium]MCL2505875.1 RdgB/HAM1 family non-canonical purine NTP pyrophosphatase [Alphaproteobacteria bacterium]
MNRRLIIATHNEGKVREFSEMLSSHFPEILSAKTFSSIAPEETGTTFTENAIIKAKALSHHAGEGTFVLADDSGLCIDALNGEPGLLSARWAEVDCNGKTVLDFPYAMRTILQKMEHVAEKEARKAHFACVLALYTDKDSCQVIEGTVHGTIAFEMRGSLGHGYDPIFVPDGFDCTFAEMDQSIKNKISHRAKAIENVNCRM